ncbi:DUF4148 domain-containing protein [Paraburkholderia phosphatilytica]|uniref:DUF4148 domain-containing protein n=1 Tax=Paraburkholderia phosphatilytica TaxID=2282883 RepID=UPI000E46EDBB|nr:DUF4148 domain-containing protein [Paraburkholderia phosphatilytica]
MTHPSAKLAVLVASVTLVAGSMTVPVYAQSNTNTGDAAVEQAASTPRPKTTKAERKAARKQARAKKNAELKKLEANGYSPSRNDPNYPQNLQNAEKKAGVGQGASQ